MLVRFSQLVAEQPLIGEMDINPLLVSHERMLALDARIVLDETPVRLAIRPYPRRYESMFTARNGEEILIRPIRPEDEPAIVKFHETLSDRSVYFRYLQMLNLTQRVAHERLIRICFIDYDREMALVAERDGAIQAVGRMRRTTSREDAEFALLVNDAFQGKGLGTAILSRLLDIARGEGIKRITADIHGENVPMLSIVRKLGFKIRRELGDPAVTAVLNL